MKRVGGPRDNRPGLPARGAVEGRPRGLPRQETGITDFPARVLRLKGWVRRRTPEPPVRRAPPSGCDNEAVRRSSDRAPGTLPERPRADGREAGRQVSPERSTHVFLPSMPYQPSALRRTPGKSRRFTMDSFPPHAQHPTGDLSATSGPPTGAGERPRRPRLGLLGARGSRGARGFLGARPYLVGDVATSAASSAPRSGSAPAISALAAFSALAPTSSGESPRARRHRLLGPGRRLLSRRSPLPRRGPHHERAVIGSSVRVGACCLGARPYLVGRVATSAPSSAPRSGSAPVGLLGPRGLRSARGLRGARPSLVARVAADAASNAPRSGAAAGGSLPGDSVSSLAVSVRPLASARRARVSRSLGGVRAI
jgi:hypothetical protein